MSVRQDARADRVVNEESALLGPPEADIVDEQESWNYPKVNAARYVSTNLTLMIMGMNDACVGVSSYRLFK